MPSPSPVPPSTAEGSSKNSPTKGSLSLGDLDAVEVLPASATAGWSSARQKGKWSQVSCDFYHVSRDTREVSCETCRVPDNFNHVSRDTHEVSCDTCHVLDDFYHVSRDTREVSCDTCQSGSTKDVAGPSSIALKNVDPSDGVGAFPKAMSLADYLELEGSDINLNINTYYYLVALGEGGDHSDHFYSNPRERKVQVVNEPGKDWVKRIQHEWKVLEKDLPDNIYVRVYEDRLELLRAVIIGPSGTPYHDGLFFFDVYFPPQYPRNPPLVIYHSGGLRLNPNLYACGKVCLSLLNTWPGDGCEKWNPSNSTLQVLVSIQALVLNAKPYFYEPGFESYANTPRAKKKSIAYNHETFLLSCKTMLYSLRNPPKVGSIIGGVKAIDKGNKGCSTKFKGSLKKLFEELMMEFIGIGVDCHEFMIDTTLKL
uniref:UBC core domain-containing protein n=1 Tax=Oryza barthii TaxID=65489 RepID=A0A0D3ESG2_9ORYZ